MAEPTLANRHVWMRWLNYPEHPGVCWACGKDWPCEPGALQEEIAALRRRVVELEDVVRLTLQVECLCPLRDDGTCNTVYHNKARAALADTAGDAGGAVGET